MTDHEKIRRIPFMPDMVRAVIAGDKTQTRRVIPTPEGWPRAREVHVQRLNGRPFAVMRWGIYQRDHRLPYDVGDTLAVIEDWQVQEGFDAFKPSEIAHEVSVRYMADGTTSDGTAMAMPGRRRWSQHMPLWASRARLKVTDLRIHPLQDITGDDMMAEGIVEQWEQVGITSTPKGHPVEVSGYRFRVRGMHDDDEGFEEPEGAFVDLWDRINADRGHGWDRNPWVAAYSFERVEL